MNSRNSNNEIRLDEWDKNYLSELYNKPIEEIVAIARENFKNVGFSEENIEFLLRFSDTVMDGYNDDIPDYVKKHLENGCQELAVIDMFED